jgi:hypothetical protein
MEEKMKNAFSLFLGVILVLSLPLAAQNRFMWQDTFNDVDPLALKSVAWSQYGTKLLPGSVVEQRDGALFMQTGSFGGMLGAVVALTSGLPEMAVNAAGLPTEETVKNLRKNYYCSPNQSVTFQVTFKKITGSFFVFATRLEWGADSLLAEPTQSPGYALLINPLDGSLLIGKYAGPNAILNPAGWKALGMGKAKFGLNVGYWVKVSMNEGAMKAKIWEGEVADEPVDWLLSGLDEDPRVSGTFSAFGMFNMVNALAGDQCAIDNVSVHKEGDDLWSDNFDDSDQIAKVNVGWAYYDATILPGTLVEQREGALFMQTGSLQGMVGAVLAETNGVPEYILDEMGMITDKGKALVKNNYYNDPNHVITGQVNFKKIDGAIFIVSTRMRPVPDSTITDPTASPGYLLVVSPIQGLVSIGKYAGPMAILNPAGWTILGAGAFKFALSVNYWFKYSLYEGEIKAKIWEGELSDEPTTWLVEGKDATPRVDGNFTMFGLLNPVKPLAKDQILLDNISVKKSKSSSTRVEKLTDIQPGTWHLQQNFPNPFNPRTEIRYQVMHNDHVEMTIFNSLGQRVTTLVDGRQAAGVYSVVWDSLSDHGAVQPSGLYFCRIKTGDFTKTIKMILSK